MLIQEYYRRAASPVRRTLVAGRRPAGEGGTIRPLSCRYPSVTTSSKNPDLQEKPFPRDSPAISDFPLKSYCKLFRRWYRYVIGRATPMEPQPFGSKPCHAERRPKRRSKRPPTVAAPELLEACKLAADYFTEKFGGKPTATGTALLAAIAKATGGVS